MKDTLNVALIGDVSGLSGKGALKAGLSSFVQRENIDFVIVNGENVSGGFGISMEDYEDFRKMGIDVITSGNHIWQKEEIYPVLDSSDDLLRPVNYSSSCPGKGFTVKEVDGVKIGVISAQGRLSMPLTDDPFETVEKTLDKMSECSLIFVDFHAEDAQEKEALAFFLDGKITALAGTHTHVQTADEKILPQGTAYITDLGMTGALHRVIGSNPEKSIERMLTQLPMKSEVSDDDGKIQGVIVKADVKSGKALSIRRFTE